MREVLSSRTPWEGPVSPHPCPRPLASPPAAPQPLGAPLLPASPHCPLIWNTLPQVLLCVQSTLLSSRCVPSTVSGPRNITGQENLAPPGRPSSEGPARVWRTFTTLGCDSGVASSVWPFLDPHRLIFFLFAPEALTAIWCTVNAIYCRSSSLECELCENKDFCPLLPAALLHPEPIPDSEQRTSTSPISARTGGIGGSGRTLLGCEMKRNQMKMRSEPPCWEQEHARLESYEGAGAFSKATPAHTGPTQQERSQDLEAALFSQPNSFRVTAPCPMKESASREEEFISVRKRYMAAPSPPAPKDKVKNLQAFQIQVVRVYVWNLPPKSYSCCCHKPGCLQPSLGADDKGERHRPPASDKVPRDEVEKGGVDRQLDTGHTSFRSGVGGDSSEL